MFTIMIILGLLLNLLAGWAVLMVEKEHIVLQMWYFISLLIFMTVIAIIIFMGAWANLYHT